MQALELDTTAYRQLLITATGEVTADIFEREVAIEDTLFVMAFGGHYSGLLIGRFAFSLVVMMGLARIVHSLPALTFRRYLFNAN